ncbi:6,7-dimethyl-8-ribityllumazine synthase [Microvirga puerhi]|uniref:6,7-dimethyl-8-ribityllumazine synthase n=1 Tax=Microvirga puerhi TaxID=2876078 RepID=A0ABS7VQX3_9HYPH|nr:6,7-dimethyl-8-ribityllumazine synthase [Microvirga puerhi]MBZ6077951.1 6,7-dimethyl-8-ribityllumazine synthase [Microvirga puerhi]
MNQSVQTRTAGARNSTEEGLPLPMRRVAFIQSCWHKDIVDRCRDAFLLAMEEGGLNRDSIDLYEVPGAFEIPLLVKKLAASRHYDAVVASGFVVNGGIYRHEFVADAVISGLMRVQLDTDIPVLSAVLTPHHFHEHDAHQAFFAGHFEVKGREAAAACLAVMNPSYGEPVAR